MINKKLWLLLLIVVAFWGRVYGEENWVAVQNSGKSLEILNQLKIRVYAILENYSFAVMDDEELELALNKGLILNIAGKFKKDNYYLLFSGVDSEFLSELEKRSQILLVMDNYALIEITHNTLTDLYVGKRRVLALGKMPIDLERYLKPVRPKKEIKAGYDPFIQQMVDGVSQLQTRNYIQTLQDFQTRNTYTEGCVRAANWIKSQLQSMRYLAFFDHYTDMGIDSNNVVGVKTGTVRPQEIYIVCAHYDCTAGMPFMPENNAPGADDNGTGTAVVLEVARICQYFDFQATIRFITFSGEEQGLFGSAHYASMAKARGDNIKGVLNLDMVGYPTPVPEDLDVVCNSQTQWLGEVYIENATPYVSLPMIITGDPPMGSSDHASFRSQGYAAICLIEDIDVPYPYYHTVNDTIEKLDIGFTTNVARATVAALAQMAKVQHIPNEPPAPATEVFAFDTPDDTGGSITVTWRKSADDGGGANDVRGYDILRRNEKYEYQVIGSVPRGFQSFKDNNTIDGINYYYLVRTKDYALYSDSEEAGPVSSRDNIPPAQVQNVQTEELEWMRLKIFWSANTENDLSGYNIYRDEGGSGFELLNPTLLEQTFYIDENFQANIVYTYYITAVDKAGNESIPSEEVEVVWEAVYTATPTPTMTSMPTLTPTPTQTINPTSSPTPTPTIGQANKKPFIFLAGYWDTRLDSEEGGKLCMMALVSDPDGREDIAEVEVLFRGEGIGIFLNDQGISGDFVPYDGVYGLCLNISEGIPSMLMLLELRARDRGGLASASWPYLFVSR